LPLPDRVARQWSPRVWQFTESEHPDGGSATSTDASAAA
jgi:hypothetical protein